MDDLSKGPPLDRGQRTQRVAIGISARNQVGAESVFRKAQQGPGKILIGNHCVTRANTGIGRRHHHHHDQLAQIEVEDLLFLMAFDKGCDDGHHCRGFGHMPGATPDLAEPRPLVLVGYNHKVPGLPIARRGCPPARFKDAVKSRLVERLTGELANVPP